MTRRLVFLALAAACASAPPPPPAPPPAAPPPPPPPAPPPPAAAAAPADPAPVEKGDVTVAAINGMQVLVKRTPGAELVAMQLHVLGGVRNWGAADAGVEQLAIQVAASGGTATLPKDAFARRLASLGATLWARSDLEHSALEAKSLRGTWTATFELLCDAFLAPALPDAEVALQRERQLVELRRELESPDDQLRALVHRTWWRGHPYEHRPVGTIENVTALDAGRLRAHLARLRETSRLLLVVVGDVEPKAVLEQARARLGALPRGGYRHVPLPGVIRTQPELVTVARKLPTNYVAGRFAGPSWRDPDFAVGMVAMEVLGQRVFEAVRTRRNLSYAAGARLAWQVAIPFGTLYTTPVDPAAAVQVMLAEVRRLQAEPVPDRELVGYRSVYLTGLALEAEATDGQASQLALAQIAGGDWELARTLADRVRAVTPAEVQAFARKHITNLLTAGIGDPAKLERAQLR